MNLAIRIFTNSAERGLLEDEFADAAVSVFGVASDDFDNWPFSDFHFDDYDRSFELTDCRPGLVLTPEQRLAFWEMGFYRGWLNFADGTERHYWSGPACSESQGRLKRKDGVYLEPTLTS